MVKLLLNLNCRCSFTDPKTKKYTLNDANGQTALYWIVTKMPDIVSSKILKSLNNKPKLDYIGIRGIRPVVRIESIS